MTEPTVQVPVSLIRRLTLMLHGPYADQAEAELLALLSQQTPSAEPTCTCGSGRSAHSDDNLMCARTQHRTDEPPCIEDMAPGTTFGDGTHRYTVDPVLLREVRRDDGQKFYADEIDPSTIRDVTPPREDS